MRDLSRRYTQRLVARAAAFSTVEQKASALTCGLSPEHLPFFNPEHARIGKIAVLKPACFIVEIGVAGPTFFRRGGSGRPSRTGRRRTPRAALRRPRSIALAYWLSDGSRTGVIVPNRPWVDRKS